MAAELRSSGIDDERVLAAMGKIPRHLFIEEALWPRAYHLSALPLGSRQTISHPLTVALMTQLLELKGTERVLEVGTGSGYQTAVLAELSEKVFSVECIIDLLVKARCCIENLGYYNVLIKLGDGSCGWAEKAPFDAIIVTAGAGTFPKQLEDQLIEGGRIVIPVGNSQKQELLLKRKIDGQLQIISRQPCKFVELVGECDWMSSAREQAV